MPSRSQKEEAGQDAGRELRQDLPVGGRERPGGGSGAGEMLGVQDKGERCLELPRLLLRHGSRKGFGESLVRASREWGLPWAWQTRRGMIRRGGSEPPAQTCQ